MKRAFFVSGFVLMVCLLTMTLPLQSQSGRGTLTGIVKDSSGAAVPKAEILIVNKDTGITTRGVTTDAGVYHAPYVQPGMYRISVSVSGFKTAIRDNVEMLITQTVAVDFNLTLSELKEEITVSAESPLLEASNSEIGVANNENEVHTWPILVSDGTRQLQSFVFRSMPGAEGNEWSGSINGGQSFSHDILVDGISIGRFDISGGSMVEFTPTVDAVSEFKLQTGALSAQYGNTQTALTNFGLKSGSNSYHGTAFWYHQNSALNANTWANNHLTLDPNTGKALRPPTRLNNQGASFGGPLKKNRTFFFASVEFHRQRDQNLASSYDSSPIREMKQGDFSRLLDPAFTQDERSGTVIGQDALGREVLFGQIYDPATTRQLPDGTWVRDPFPGNIIPPGRLSQLTSKILNPAYALPDPTFPLRMEQGETLRGNTLRVGTGAPILNINNWSLKFDHLINDKHKVSMAVISNDRYRYRYGGYHLPGNIPNVPAAGDSIQATPGWLVRFAEDWTISRSKLNHFAYGYNRFTNSFRSSTYEAKDWAADLGMQNVGGVTFPVIMFSGPDAALSGSYKKWGDGSAWYGPNGSNIVSDDFTWIRGSHSFRFGGEHRRYYDNGRGKDIPGTYYFDSNQTGLPTFAGQPFAKQTGFAFTSFLLGAARNTDLYINGTTLGVRSRVTAFYAQDDWKVTPKLTLNLGVRWDIPTSYSSPNDTMSGLDPKLPNPGADGYPGALTFLGNCPACSGKSRWNSIYYRQFGPRLGFAYAATGKLVWRGGFGTNYAPPILDGWVYYWWDGFNGINSINPRTNRPTANDPAYWWDTPYPKYTAPLPNYDPAQLNGGYISYYPPETKKYPMVSNWNFGVQYELPGRAKLEVNYVGNHGTRLNDPYHYYGLNQVDPKNLSWGDILMEDIEQHPEFQKPYPSFIGTVGQSLRPFPQYLGIYSHRTNGGWSNYHALQITATRRSSMGLSFLVAYTFSKTLGTSDEASGYGYGGYGQSIYSRKADYSVSFLNVPHDLRITWIYDFPFGKSRKWASSGWRSALLGGWTISAIQRYRSGDPLGIGSSSGPTTEALFNPGFYTDVLLPRDQQVIAGKPTKVDESEGVPYLNPNAFGNVPVTANNVALRLGNGTRLLPNLRGWSKSYEDMSIMKRIPLGFREGAYFEIRADIQNLFNRVFWQDPETDIGDPVRFGRVFGKCPDSDCSARTIQLGARISF
jgi:hypothetical protein